MYFRVAEIKGFAIIVFQWAQRHPIALPYLHYAEMHSTIHISSYKPLNIGSLSVPSPDATVPVKCCEYCSVLATSWSLSFTTSLQLNTILLSPMSSSNEWTVCRASSCTYHSRQNMVLSTALNLSTACTRDVTKFEFEHDDVRTSNVFTRFKIRLMF